MPSTVHELRQVLGLINFQRQFIKAAARILVPLTTYLQGHAKNKDKLDLDDEPKQAFEEIKTQLAHNTGSAHPQIDVELRLFTDASKVAIGEILTQRLPDRSEQVLAYFSKPLNETQRRYPVFDLELLAVFLL